VAQNEQGQSQSWPAQLRNRAEKTLDELNPKALIFRQKKRKILEVIC
jgi:hypothetical protein